MKKIYLGGKHNDKFAIVDDDLFDELSKYKWQYDSHGYATRREMINGEYKNISMHRFIYELKFGKIPDGLLVDHVNRNGLLNIISNLRLATKRQNACNKLEPRNNVSGFRGITKTIKKDRKGNDRWEYWLAKVNYKKKQYTKLFPYTDEGFEQAKAWRIMKEKELFGEFAP